VFVIFLKTSIFAAQWKWYAFPEYKDKPDFAEYIAGKIYSLSYISLHSALAFYGSMLEVLSVDKLVKSRFSDDAAG
jgi:hypothetical protein